MSLVFDARVPIHQVTLAGCGGTGAQWARSLARILYDMKRRGLATPDLLLVDPDRVESANVGRQLFTPADVGQPKCEVLTRRFNAALGLQIEWAAEPFDPRRHVHAYGTLLCGAVDNHDARRALAQARNAIWVDAGNHTHSGQLVTAGTTGDPEQLRQALHHALVQGTPLAHLPNAALLFPTLLEPEPEARPDANLSCADIAAHDAQGLLINDLMATLAARTCQQLLHRQPLHTFLIHASISHYPVVTSVPLEPDELLARIAHA